MSLRRTHSVGLVVLSTLAGCGILGGGHSTTPASSAAAPTTNARLFTDADEVHGVAASHTDLFVATSRGLLRYPLAGGAPTRLTHANGLPDDRVYAVSVTPDGVVWVATASGVARLLGESFSPAGGVQPDVGRPTALLALEGGVVLLGGSQGIARFDGMRWLALTDRYQVLGFARDQGRTLVATAQSGVLALRDDATGLDEYGTASGLPETLARAVVPAGAGRFWTLLQGSDGARLEYFDGHRWVGYTHASVRTPWIALVPSPRGAGTASLVTANGMFDLVPSGGDALVATDVGSPDGAHHVDLHPSEVTAPAPAPVTSNARGGGASARANANANATASANASAAPPAHDPPPRPRNVPGFAAPIEVPTTGAVAGAPRFALAPTAGVTLPSDAELVVNDPSGLYVARAGNGVARVAGGAATEFRTRDLSVAHHALSLATDSNGTVWFVADDGGVVRFDGRHFTRGALDDDAAAVPLLFWSRGVVAAAVARVGNDRLRAYRFAEGAWQPVTERRINLGGPGVLGARFLAVDDRGRFWVGVRAEREGHTREYGLAVIDGNLPGVQQLHAPHATHAHRAPRAGASAPSATVPDDLASIEFDSNGSAWFAGISGATSVTLANTARGAATVHAYGEANGVRGDLVNDVSIGPGGRVYFATPEGIGYFANDHFAWDLPGSESAAHVMALAWDPNGTLWGAGPEGAWAFDGHAFRAVGHDAGLPTQGLTDVAVDGNGRAYFASADGLYVLGERPAGGDSAPPPSSGGDDTAGL